MAASSDTYISFEETWEKCKGTLDRIFFFRGAPKFNTGQQTTHDQQLLTLAQAIHPRLGASSPARTLAENDLRRIRDILGCDITSYELMEAYTYFFRVFSKTNTNPGELFPSYMEYIENISKDYQNELNACSLDELLTSLCQYTNKWFTRGKSAMFIMNYELRIKKFDSNKQLGTWWFNVLNNLKPKISTIMAQEIFGDGPLNPHIGEFSRNINIFFDEEQQDILYVPIFEHAKAVALQIWNAKIDIPDYIHTIDTVMNTTSKRLESAGFTKPIPVFREVFVIQYFSEIVLHAIQSHDVSEIIFVNSLLCQQTVPWLSFVFKHSELTQSLISFGPDAFDSVMWNFLQQRASPPEPVPEPAPVLHGSSHSPHAAESDLSHSDSDSDSDSDSLPAFPVWGTQTQSVEDTPDYHEKAQYLIDMGFVADMGTAISILQTVNGSVARAIEFLSL